MPDLGHIYQPGECEALGDRKYAPENVYVLPLEVSWRNKPVFEVADMSINVSFSRIYPKILIQSQGEDVEITDIDTIQALAISLQDYADMCEEWKQKRLYKVIYDTVVLAGKLKEISNAPHQDH